VLKITKQNPIDINFKKAGIYFTKKELDSAMFYSMKYLSRKDKELQLTNYCLFFRSVFFQNKKLFNQAERELNLVSKNFSFYHLVKFKLGTNAIEQRKFKKAINYFLDIEKLAKSNFNEGLRYENIGLCYLHLRKFILAKEYLFKSLKISEQNKDTLRVITSYTNIANLFYEEYKDKEAIVYFKKAYQLSKYVKDFKKKQNTALNMAVIEENRNNLFLALKYRKEYEVWKDSLNDQDKVWVVAETEKKHAVKEKEKEINLLEAENKLKNAEKNGLIIISILLLVLFGTGLFFYKLKIKQNRIIMFQKEKLNDLNITKDRLFSIVSHDLLSSMNALKTSKNKLLNSLESKNYEQLDKLLHTNSSIVNSTYSLLDNLLNWAMLQTKQAFFYQEFHSLSNIVEQVVYNYSPIMFDKQIQFKKEIPDDIFVFVDLDAMKIILRNILDNAIKFSNENDFISIYVELHNNKICDLIIQDTGCGITIDTQNELLKENFSISKDYNNKNAGTGLGMQLCKSLITKNEGKLSIESEINMGTKIIISLPFKT
jgi:signal transduction histidine kinase